MRKGISNRDNNKNFNKVANVTESDLQVDRRLKKAN